MMAIEGKRGCGYRKVGGMYLVGTGYSIPCHRLPVPLHVCPTCGAGVKFSRGFTWIEPKALFGACPQRIEEGHCPCSRDNFGCPICCPPEGRAGLLWVGAKHYTPEDFTQEAITMGVSKRVASMIRGLEIGKTWIYLAHKKAVPAQKRLIEGDNGTADKGEKATPGIFYAFVPQRVEKIITTSQATKEEIEKLEKRGITPVIVPDDDPDHNPKKSETGGADGE